MFPSPLKVFKKWISILQNTLHLIYIIKFNWTYAEKRQWSARVIKIM